MREKEYDFSFDPTVCESCDGHCCTGDSGYTWLSEQEISKIADYLGQDIDGFISGYLVRIGGRFCIKEVKIEGGFYCLFFDEKNRRCAIYDVRPVQCKTFPFWEYFKDKPDEVTKECPGVKRISPGSCRISDK